MQNEPLDRAQMAAAAEALSHAEASKAAEKAATKRQAELIERGRTPWITVLLGAAFFGCCVYVYTQNWHISILGGLAGAFAAHAYTFVMRTIKLARKARESGNAT